jgi:hypothetical protein
MNVFFPPRRTERILEALGAHPDFRDAVLGDLAEEFELRARWDGPAIARRWYFRESLRVAPYFLRNWWRGLKGRDIAELVGVMVGSSIFVVAFESLLGFIVNTMDPVWQLFSLSGIARSIVIPALMLLWTSFDGLLAGSIAARLGELRRRAPLPGVILLAVAWSVVLVALQSSAVVLWFRSVNVVAAMVGILAGGLICAGRPIRPAHIQ